MSFEAALPEGLQLEGRRVVKYSGNARELAVPEWVEGISAFAFSECRTLQRIRLPESCRYIGALAFNGCTSLGEVTLGFSGLMDIGWSVFYGCQCGVRLVFAGDSQMLEKNFGPRYDPPEYEFMYGERCEGKWHYPLGHELGDAFYVEASCVADGVNVRMKGHAAPSFGYE